MYPGVARAVKNTYLTSFCGTYFAIIGNLDAPIKRLGAPFVPASFSSALERLI